MTANRIIDVTFDRNKIESCGFHRRKEEMKTHRNIYQTVFKIGFLRLF
jgi:hypothetical protein